MSAIGSVQPSQGESSCSFCGRKAREVERLISGPGVYICDRCVLLSAEMLREEKAPESGRSFLFPKPAEIKCALDQHVVGQEKAKKVLSVAVYNHYKRINVQAGKDDVELPKSNILLVGPTGAGKTLLAQTLARILQVPFTIADATSLTEAGYVGEDVENILLRLLQASDFDLEMAEKGIIYIDEIDKIARKSAGPSRTRDVSGEGVQQGLLKMVESTAVRLPSAGGRKSSYGDSIQMNSKDILFIAGGSFEGLSRIIQERKGGKRLKEKAEGEIGDLNGEIMPEDLLKFGMIPEFIGRFPVVVAVHSLSEEELIRVLTQPKNALLKQYQKLLEMDGVELVFTESACRAVARSALKQKTGARGLRTVLEELMLNLMYELPSRKEVGRCVITASVVQGKREPALHLTARQPKRNRVEDS